MARRVVDLGKTKLTWVDDLADPENPTVDELNGGVDLTELMSTNYEVRADTSDTVSEKAVSETFNSDTPTAGNYMGNLILFRQWDDEEEEWDASLDPTEIFPTAGALGYFVRREGIDWDTAYADGQNVETYKFATDNPQTAGGTDQGYQKATVPLHKQGVMHLDATVVGSSTT